MSICIWAEDNEGNWWTQCDNGFVFANGGPTDNGMTFCCYCGGKLSQHLYRHDDEDVVHNNLSSNEQGV